MGRLRSVGAGTVKSVVDSVVGQGQIKDSGLVVGMPGKSSVHIFKEAFFDHESLASRVFFGRTSKIQDSAGKLFLFHDIFQEKNPCQNSAAQEIMSAAVPCRRTCGSGSGGICFLRQAGKGIIFPQKTQYGSAIAPAGSKSGGEFF